MPRRIDARVDELLHRPPTDTSGIPRDGARYGTGAVVRRRSLGPGVPLHVRNRLGRRPNRLVGYSTDDKGRIDTANSDLSTLVIDGIEAPEGTELVFILE